MFDAIFQKFEFYYDTPFQVIFLRPDIVEPTYEQGIAYKNEIIAARDGKVFTTLQAVVFARRCGIDGDYAIVEAFEWKPLDMS